MFKYYDDVAMARAELLLSRPWMGNRLGGIGRAIGSGFRIGHAGWAESQGWSIALGEVSIVFLPLSGISFLHMY